MRPASVVPEDGRHQEGSESFRGPSVHAIPSQEKAPAVLPTLDRAAALNLSKPDPGLLDRLTDNVIRRVEQRIRIERQRRGL